MCTHPIDPLVIHFLCCAHGNKCTWTHDVICDAFVTIVQNDCFHIRQEQLHVFLSPMLKSSHRQVDILFTKNGIRTLIYIVIINPMHVYLLPQSCTIQRFTSNATQAKKKSYHNQQPTDQFFLLAIEIFGCLHKQANVLLHNYANIIWSLKRPKGPPLSILVIFLHKNKSITLQRMQSSSILNGVLTVNLDTLRHTSHHHDRLVISGRWLR